MSGSRRPLPVCSAILLSQAGLPSAITKCALFCLLLVSMQAATVVSCAAADTAALNHAVDLLTKKYSLEIVTSQPTFPVGISGHQASQEALAAYLPILVAEWNLYPVSLIKKVGLKRIIICDGLSVDLGDLDYVPGFNQRKRVIQPRAGIPDFDHHDLYFDARLAADNRRYVCETIHHEFFHCIDQAIAAEKGRAFDVEWNSFNPEDFCYGGGGVWRQNDPKAGVNDSSLVGFLNTYSQSAMEEDKAEIFANMMMDRVGIEERAEKDHYIAGKIRRIEAILLEFCPDITRAFWRAARTLPRPYLDKD